MIILIIILKNELAKRLMYSHAVSICTLLITVILFVKIL